MRPRPAGAVGASQRARRSARTGSGPVRVPPDDRPGPTTRACSSVTRVPAYRDLRGDPAWMARDRAERPAGTPDDRPYRIPHDRAPDVLIRTDHFRAWS